MITSEQYRQIQECKNCGLTMAETGRRLHIPASVVAHTCVGGSELVAEDGRGFLQIHAWYGV